MKDANFRETQKPKPLIFIQGQMMIMMIKINDYADDDGDES